MHMIFVNLLVQDLGASTDFYVALGMRLHEPFSDESSASLVVDDTIVVVLNTRERFATLVAGDVGDPSASTTVVHSLVVDERAGVDALVETALSSGGRPWLPAQADGARYTASFVDPDGNPWQVVWLDQLHVVN